MVKAKAKADRSAARAAAAGALAGLPGGQSPMSSRAHTPVGGPSTPGDDDVLTSSIPIVVGADTLPILPAVPAASPKEPVVDRADLLREHSQVVNRFIRLMIPILVDVYAASVSVSVRIKSLASLLKAICFQEEEQLQRSLKVIYL